MASPPYRSPATSPPYPPHTALPLPNPKKRPSLVLNAHGSKRRKPSSFSTTSGGHSAHPLRQTSFPPEEANHQNALRSPSVESDFTAVTGDKGGSVVTAGAGATAVIGVKKKRGRKPKIKAGSLKSGTEKATGTVDGRSGKGDLDDDAVGEEDDEEGEGEGDEGMIDEGGRVDKAAEKKKMAVLIDAFNTDQADRYDMYRRVKLKKETVRKITNQTLSQSVPPSVITTVNGFTKVFIGTIIERAREVQQQWAAAEASLPSPNAEVGSNQDAIAKGAQNLPATDTSFENDTLMESVPSPERKPRIELGPLLPDHLREALRRYKRDGEGGGAGLEGWSVGMGLRGTGSARLGGKRLFR